MWPFQPSCSATKLHTQAVSLPDERHRDTSMTHRSSGVGGTPGNGWNDPSYSNVFAKLMSWYTRAPSVKGHGDIGEQGLYGCYGGLYLQVPWCHRGIKIDSSRGGAFISSKSPPKSFWRALSPGVLPYWIYTFFGEFCINQTNVWKLDVRL